MDGRQGSSSSFRTPQRRISSLKPANSTSQRVDIGLGRPRERAGESLSDEEQRDGSVYSQDLIITDMYLCELMMLGVTRALFLGIKLASSKYMNSK